MHFLITQNHAGCQSTRGGDPRQPTADTSPPTQRAVPGEESQHWGREAAAGKCFHPSQLLGTPEFILAVVFWVLEHAGWSSAVRDQFHHGSDFTLGQPQGFAEASPGMAAGRGLLPAPGAGPGCSRPRAPALLPSACGRWEENAQRGKRDPDRRNRSQRRARRSAGRVPSTWEQQPRGAWDQQRSGQAVLAPHGLPGLPAAQHCTGAFQEIRPDAALSSQKTYRKKESAIF